MKILSAKIENIANYLGFLGEYFRLEINADVNGVKSQFKFFMKSLPVTDLKQRKMLVDTGIFKKETTVYATLITDLSRISEETGSRWCPKIYLSRDDLLVQEDLSLKGYQILPFKHKFTQPQVEMTLKTLARFHCSSIVYEKRNEGKSIEDKFGETLFETSVANITWFHAGLKVALVFSLSLT